jgi:hypothetical protein
MNDVRYIPVYDLQIVKGINYEMSFQLALGIVNNDGTYTITGPLDLTGKVIRVIVEGIFSSTFVLNSDTGPTANGSEINITDAPEGLFNFKLTGTELDAIRETDGKWRMLLIDGLNVDMIVYGSVLEVDLYAG